MEIKGEYRIARDRQAVWAGLNDAEILKKCIPGCESLEKQEDGSFKARVAAAIGPVRAKFDTTLRFENVNPPQSYTLTGESRAGAAGFGRGAADVMLSERDGGTLLSYSADFKVGGKLAQVGSRLVLGATRKTAEDFFGCFSRALDAGGAASAAPDAAPSTRSSLGPSRGWWIALALIVLLLAGWFLLVS